MDSGRTAVWLLELVTSSDRATSIVGDFMEESSEHDRFWFWLQVTRTLLAHMGREFMSAPFRLLLCAPMSIAFYVVGQGLLMVVLLPLMLRMLRQFPSFAMEPAYILLALAYVTLVYLRGGWVLAELTKRPLAASIVFAASYALYWEVQHVGQARFLPSYGVPQALVLMGAICQRRHSVRSLRAAR